MHDGLEEGTQVGMESLKSIIDQHLIATELQYDEKDDYYCHYTSGVYWYEIKTVSFHGTLQDVNGCIMAAVKVSFGYSPGITITDKDEPGIHEFPASDFEGFLQDMLDGFIYAGKRTGSTDLHMEMMKLEKRLESEAVRMFVSSIRYGYLCGGILALLRESTEEIAVILVNVTD